MVDHINLNRTLGRLKFETHLLLKRIENARQRSEIRTRAFPPRTQ